MTTLLTQVDTNWQVCTEKEGFMGLAGEQDSPSGAGMFRLSWEALPLRSREGAFQVSLPDIWLLRNRTQTITWGHCGLPCIQEWPCC